jgi:ribosomal protein S18 acetylase RimI-like enzyme
VEAILPHIEDKLQYFTLLADVTTLAERCRFGLGPHGSLAARYMDLPFAAAAFYGRGKGLGGALGQVLEPDERCYTLVGDQQYTELASVAEILSVDPEWQMVYRGEAKALQVGEAVPLGQDALPAMRRLAELGGLHAFEKNPLEKGPYSGVWRDPELASMAGTHLRVAYRCVARYGEIGNVVTAPRHRRQGLAHMAVAATTRALLDAGFEPMLQVYKTNVAAIALYEQLGYQRVRTMYLVRFCLPS